jgi:prepilin-type N-terminal cleavage/methylation domain-containing protein
MKAKIDKDKILNSGKRSEQGFSLIETVIALVTLGVCLAYAMPLFLYAKINNSKSEIRTGALIVSQRVFDNIRSKPIDTLPSNDGVASPSPGVNPVSVPINIASPLASEKIITYAMGRQYQTTVTYCQGLAGTPAVVGPPAIPATPADPTVCTAQYRKFKVEVNYNGSKVYDLEGTYTEFE